MFRKGIELRTRQIWNTIVLLSHILLQPVLRMTQQKELLGLLCHLQRHPVKRGKKYLLARFNIRFAQRDDGVYRWTTLKKGLANFV